LIKANQLAVSYYCTVTLVRSLLFQFARPRLANGQASPQLRNESANKELRAAEKRRSMVTDKKKRAVSQNVSNSGLRLG